MDASSSSQGNTVRRTGANPTRPPVSEQSLLPLEQLQAVANASLQSRAVQVTELESYRCPTYKLRTSPDFFYLLRTSPPASFRLLRHEERLIEDEVAALHALKGRSDLIHTRVIDYQNHGIRLAPLGSRYHVTGPFTGQLLANVKASLSKDQMSVIQASLGQHFQHLSSIIGPSFGPLHRAHLLPQTWSGVFTALLQSLLRDGEEALVDLPYRQIRESLHRHRSALNRVATPRLVILDAACDLNIAVDHSYRRVTDILEYATAIWGDPLLCDLFYRPNPDFIRGYGGLPTPVTGEKQRKALYLVYHSVLAIMRDNYRRDQVVYVSMADAREDLRVALQKLETA